MSRRQPAQKLSPSERWKHRRAPTRVTPIAPAPVVLAPMAPAPVPLINEAQARTRIARWVIAQVVNYAPDRCLCCHRPITYGAKWIELVNDNARARFHADCAPAWRVQQEAAARRALGLTAKSNTNLQPSGAHT